VRVLQEEEFIHLPLLTSIRSLTVGAQLLVAQALEHFTLAACVL
jgi:hypothetical protein